MKLAYMYATPEITHTKVTAIQGDIESTLKKIKDIGFTGVELLVRNPEQIDQPLLLKTIKRLNLEVPMICTGEIYGEDFVSLADPNKDTRNEAIKRMKNCLRLAANLNSMVNIGRFRGRFTNEMKKTDTEKYFSNALIECSGEYEEIPIIIEPVNHQYANYLMTTDATLDFVKSINKQNVGMMLDLEHVIQEDESLSESINKTGDYLKHIHICDSNRMPPGLGNYNFDVIFNILEESRYNQYITVESFQKPSSNLAIESSYQTLKKYF